MELYDLSRAHALPVTAYASHGASSLTGARGEGAAHVHVVWFEPGGMIGPHEAGPGQLFLVVEGSGWVQGDDGARHPIRAGEAARFAPGERHAKGSDAGMTAVMVQVERLEGIGPPRA